MKETLLLCVFLIGACDPVETEVTRSEPYSEDLPMPVGAPTSFTRDDSRTDPRSGRIGECPSHLVDAAGDVRLRLSRSRSTTRRKGDNITIRSYGDYFVQPGDAYGGSPDELLRVDCARRAPVGWVAS